MVKRVLSCFVLFVILVLVLSCGVPEDPGQLTVYADRISYPGLVSLTLYADRIDLVRSLTPNGPESIVTLTDEDVAIEVVGRPALEPSVVFTGFVEPCYVKQLRIILYRAVAQFDTGETADVKLTSQDETGQKLVPKEEVRITIGATTNLTVRLDPEKSLIRPPGQGLLLKPVLTLLLGRVTSFPVNEFVPGQLLLWFNEGTPQEQIDAAIVGIGATVLWTDTEILLYLVQLPGGMSEAQGRDAFLATGLVDAYTLNWMGIGAYTPSDDGYYSGCFLDRIKVTGAGKSALNVTQGSPEVIVAVIDSGLALKSIGPPYEPYEDFISTTTGKSKLWLNPGEDLDAATGGKPGDGVLTIEDFNNVDDDANGIVDDLNGVYFKVVGGAIGLEFEVSDRFYTEYLHHGTAVASIIASELDNDSNIGSPGDPGVEMVGVSPNVTVMPLKVIQANINDLYFASYIRALRYAKQNGAHITNSSLAFHIDTSLEKPEGWENLFGQVVSNWKKGWDRSQLDGMLHVVCAGNDGMNIVANEKDTFFFPAELDKPNVITVGGTMPFSLDPSIDERAVYPALYGASNFSKTAVHLGAPYEVFAMWPNGLVYPGWYGTSFSAPQVAGVAALLMGQRPELRTDPSLVRDIILKNVTKSPQLVNVFLTEGTLNALKCVSAPSVRIEPLPSWVWASTPVAFIGSGSLDPDGNNLVTYKWTFGDGVEETGPFANVDTTHTYGYPGIYEIRLELTNDLTPEPAVGIARTWLSVIE